MTTNASKFGLRAAAAERRGKHAQRTPLPPRRGQVADAQEAIAMAKDINKKSKKLAKAAKAEAAKAPESAARPLMGEIPPRTTQEKSFAFVRDAKALGWDTDIKLAGKETLTDVVTASRGDEVIQIEWQGGVFIPNCIYRRPDGTTSKMQNAAAARRQMAAPAPTAQQLAARKATAAKLSGAITRQPVRSIPFDMDLVNDAELAEALKGRKIVWVNSISGVEDQDIIPPSAHVRVDEGFSGRQVHFNGPTGARSIRLRSVTHVSGSTLKQRKHAA